MGINDILDELEEMKSVEEFEMEISMHGRDFNSIPESKKKPVSELMARSHSGFKLIPIDYLTPEMVDMEKHRLCSQNDVPNEIASGSYSELVSHLLCEGHIYFFSIHPGYITKPLLLLALHNGRNGGLFLDKKTDSLIFRLIDEEVANAMVALDVSNLCQIPDSSIVSNEALMEGLMRKPEKGYVLANLGRKDILQEAVKNGLWVGNLKKPNSLPAAIKLRMQMRNGALAPTVYLDAFISNHPPEEVIPLMKSESRRKVLLNLYSADVLLKLMPEDNFVKGALLDRSLGL